MRFARGYRKFVVLSVDSVPVLALESPFTTITITITGMYEVSSKIDVSRLL